MKIIPPIELNQSNTVSTAPSDGFSVWAPVGRDFLTDLDIEAMAAIDDTAYFALNSNSRIVYIVDLSTGAISEFDAGINISAIKPSPDGLYFAVTTKPSNFYRVTVYRVSDGADVYSFDASTLSRAHNDWSFDSGLFLHSLTLTGDLADLRLVSVDTTTWSVESQSATYSAIAQAVTGESGLFPSFFDDKALTAYKDSDFCSLIYLAQFSASGQPSVFEHLIIRFDISTMSYTSRVLRSGSFFSSYYRAAHNAARNELLIYFPDAPQAISDSTLADSGLSPSVPACDEVSVNADNTQLIFRSSSVTPKFNRIDATDYTSDSSLDAILPSEGRSVAYSDDFYVFTMESFGYALIDRTTEALEVETNPSVSEGDIFTYQDKNYEALADNTDRPDQGVTADPPTWLDRGAINPLRMFDGKLDSLTAASEELIIGITPGKLANAIALFNVTAQTVRITVEDPDEGQVYDSGTIAMRDNSGVLGWYDYFFSPRPQKRDLARIDLPAYPNAEVSVTISSEGEDVAVGEIALGRVQTLGETQYGSSVSITDSSRKERDQFGNFNIIERPFSKRAEYDVHLPRAATSGVQRILSSYRAKPIVYLKDIEEEALLLYGFFIDFSLNYQNFSLTSATITVEGL